MAIIQEYGTILKEDGRVECTIGDGDSPGSIECKKMKWHR